MDTFSKSGMSGVKGGEVKGCGWSCLAIGLSGPPISEIVLPE